jgi:hypothetical protein
MKLAKSLALGSAAALVTMTGVANAADLPGAEPVDYVKVCDIKGSTGFFYIPGTETCLQIGGFARLEMTTAQLRDNTAVGDKEDKYNRTGYRVRARVWFDARTDTEYGALRTFVRLQFQRETGVADSADRRAQNSDMFGDDSLFDQAFVQFAGLTAGVTDSFWDFKPYTTFQNPFISDRTVPVLAYTLKAGDFSASLALEDQSARWVSTAQSLQQSGQEIPDIVANLRVKQGWGEAQLSGVAHQINPDSRFVSPYGGSTGSSEWGWGVQGGLKVNLPTANTSDAKGDFVWAQAGYVDGGGLSYLGLNDANVGSGRTQNITLNFGQLVRDFVIVNGEVEKTKAINANIGVLHYWSPKWRSSLAATYVKVNYKALPGTGDADWSAGTVTGNLVWSPVKKLDIGGEVVYARNLDRPATYTGLKRDAFIGRLRVQRDF